MKDHAKIILYAYPLLKTVGKDYEEHIRNRALLSCDGRWTAEKTAEYLAEEILDMRRLEWLKVKVEEILSKLTEEEKILVAIRYFGKKKSKNRSAKEILQGLGWTERSYFRKQARLEGKLGGLFVACGLTEQVYERDYARIDIFQKVARALKNRGDKKISANEQRWLEE